MCRERSNFALALAKTFSSIDCPGCEQKTPIQGIDSKPRPLLPRRRAPVFACRNVDQKMNCTLDMIIDERPEGMAPPPLLRNDGCDGHLLDLPCQSTRCLQPENGPRTLCILAQAVAQTGDAVAITAATGVIQFVNTSFERTTGYSSAEAVGQTFALVNSGVHPPELFAQLWKTIARGEVFRGVLTNRRKAGDIYHEEKTITPIRDESGRISHFISTGRDVSERIFSHACLEHQANHDLLTGLPNRSLFLDRLAHAMHRASREAGNVALLFIDLDRFKSINDSFGHDIGDRVLIKVAERLKRVVREEDSVARIGGDEFTVILEGLKSPADSDRVAAELVAAFEASLEIDGQSLEIGASIGIATYPEDGDGIDLLLRRADVAMFHAKDSGRSTYAHFSAVMEGARIEEKSVATALDSALANDEFEVYYQAIVDPRDQRTVAVEALLRWQSPLHGEVPPSRFIPLLEAGNQILEVGKWFMATACRQIKALQRPDLAGMVVSVNLSGRQFRDRNLLGDIAEVLRESGLDPCQLQLEVAEGALLVDVHAAAHTLTALKALGVRLAIDDFGIGYSSLCHLRNFPINMLKIDLSLVAELGTSADALWMVKTIIALADSLGIESTAEGVETAGQLTLLSALGCSSVQGYWFHRPSPLQQLRTGWLAEKPVPRQLLRPGTGGPWA